MTVGRPDVRQSLQSPTFDTIDFVKATRTMNLDKLTSLLNECKMESRCELSDNVTAQYEMFINLYDDISMVGKDEIKAIDGQSKRLLNHLNSYIQDVEKLKKLESENVTVNHQKEQLLIDNHSVSTMQSIIKQVKALLGTQFDSEKILFQYSILDRLNSSTKNGRSHELFMDFKEELKVKLEQLALSCLYDMNEAKWQYVCNLFAGLQKADELAELVYKAKVQPLIFRFLSKTSNTPFNISLDTMMNEMGQWSQLQSIYEEFPIDDYHDKFVIGSLWRPMAEAILERSEVFSPTHTERFHDGYLSVVKLIEYFEKHLIKSRQGLQSFRNVPTVVKLRNDWQFNVYFQLVFRSYASKFEDTLKVPKTEWKAVIECAEEVLSDIWGNRVFLMPLMAKFLRMSLQLEGRIRLAAIPKILEQATLPESNEIGNQIMHDMKKLNRTVKEKIEELVKDGLLRDQILDQSFECTEKVVKHNLEKLPELFVEKFMSSMDAILNGNELLDPLINQCVIGLEDNERESVLREFSAKFTERAKEYLRMAVKREENWKRLKQMALEDNDLSDVQQPEPVDHIKQRILCAVEQLSKHSTSECVNELKQSLS